MSTSTTEALAQFLLKNAAECQPAESRQSFLDTSLLASAVGAQLQQQLSPAAADQQQKQSPTKTTTATTSIQQLQHLEQLQQMLQLQQQMNSPNNQFDPQSQQQQQFYHCGNSSSDPTTSGPSSSGNERIIEGYSPFSTLNFPGNIDFASFPTTASQSCSENSGIGNDFFSMLMAQILSRDEAALGNTNPPAPQAPQQMFSGCGDTNGEVQQQLMQQIFSAAALAVAHQKFADGGSKSASMDFYSNMIQQLLLQQQQQHNQQQQQMSPEGRNQFAQQLFRIPKQEENSFEQCTDRSILQPSTSDHQFFSTQQQSRQQYQKSVTGNDRNNPKDAPSLAVDYRQHGISELQQGQKCAKIDDLMERGGRNAVETVANEAKLAQHQQTEKAKAMSVIGESNSAAADMSAYCEICDKQLCNRYFLKTHKLKKHGIGSGGMNRSLNTSEISIGSIGIEIMNSGISPLKPSGNFDTKSGILNVPHGSRLEDQTIQQQFASLPGQLNISGIGAGTSLRGIQSEEQHQERQLNVLENLWANILGTTNTGNDVGELTMEQKQFIFAQLMSNLDVDQIAKVTSLLAANLNKNEQSSPQMISSAEQLKPFSALLTADGASNVRRASLNDQQIQRRQYSSAGRNFCTFCNKEVCNKYFLRTHMLKMHNIVIDENKPVIGNIDTLEKERLGAVSFRCEFCLMELQSRNELRMHKEEVHGQLLQSTTAKNNEQQPSLVEHAISIELLGSNGNQKKQNHSLNFRKTAQQTETEKSAQMDLLSTESPFLFEKNIKSAAEEENQMPTLLNENEILNDLNVRIHANNLAKVPTDVLEQLQLDTDITKEEEIDGSKDGKKSFACQFCTNRSFDDESQLELHNLMEHLNEMQQKQMARQRNEKPGSDDDETRPAFKEDPQQQKMLFDAESTINQIAIRWHNEQLQQQQRKISTMSSSSAATASTVSSSSQCSASSTKAIEGSFSCSMCKRVYKSQQRLKNHQQATHHRFISSISLSPVKRTNQNGPQTLNLPRKKIKLMRNCFVCNKCQERFTKRADWAEHIAEHLRVDECSNRQQNKAIERQEFKTKEDVMNRQLQIIPSQEMEKSDLGSGNLRDASSVAEKEVLRHFGGADAGLYDKNKLRSVKVENIDTDNDEERDVTSTNSGSSFSIPTEHQFQSTGGHHIDSSRQPAAQAEVFNPPTGFASITEKQPYALQSFVLRKISDANACTHDGQQHTQSASSSAEVNSVGGNDDDAKLFDELLVYLPVRSALTHPRRVEFELVPKTPSEDDSQKIWRV